MNTKTTHPELIELPAIWERATLSPAATLQDAIQKLNEAAIKIVLVVDGEGKLEGTISDGDIRRGLLQGLTLADSITGIVQRSPLVVPDGVSREFVLQLMAANKIQQIPVVDAKNRLIGLHLWDSLAATEKRPNLMVIMAGGLGTRLRPHTESCPKPMLSVAGKPMLEHIIERAISEGFDQFVLAIHYLGHMIEDYFGDGARMGVRIGYLKEDSPLGTAGALSLLSPKPELPFIVTNGDVLTDVHYGELLDFHVRHSARATMAVRTHEWQHPFGVVRTQGVEIVGLEEKPIYRSRINAGVYVLDPTVLDVLRTGERCDMPMLFDEVRAQEGRTIVYPMHEPWLDVGKPSDYAEAGRALAGSTISAA